MILVAPTDFFKTLTTWKFFFSRLFFAIAIPASSIAILEAVKKVTMGKVRMRFFLTSFRSLNQIFLEAVYSFSFLIYCYNICLIDFFAGLLAGN